MTPCWRHSLLLFVVMFLTAPPLPGQILIPRQDRWEVSGFFGGAGIHDRQFLTPVADGSPPRSVGLEYEAGIQAGFRVGENLGRYVTAELEYSFNEAPLTLTDVRPGVARLEVDHNVHSILYGVTVSPFERTDTIRPYGAVSAGAALYQISSDSEEAALLQGVDLRDRWQFAWAFGGGVKVRLGRQTGLRIDVRDQISGVPGYGLPEVAPVEPSGSIGAALRTDGSHHNWQFNAGVYYTFGRR